MPDLTICTLTQITKGGTVSYKKPGTGRNVSVYIPEQFECIIVDEAHYYTNIEKQNKRRGQKKRKNKGSDKGTETDIQRDPQFQKLKKLRSRTKFLYVTSFHNFGFMPFCRVLMSGTFYGCNLNPLTAALSLMVSPALYNDIENEMSRWYY